MPHKESILRPSKRYPVAFVMLLALVMPITSNKASNTSAFRFVRIVTKGATMASMAAGLFGMY
jgi:hypothetical protein